MKNEIDNNVQLYYGHFSFSILENIVIILLYNKSFCKLFL